MTKDINSFTPEGYNLIEVESNSWAIQVIGDTVFTGTFREVILFSIVRLGFTMEELNIALNDMLTNGDDTAHFGIYRTFLYTFHTGWKHNRKVG